MKTFYSFTILSLPSDRIF